MSTLNEFQDSVKKGDLETVRSALMANPAFLNASNEAGQSSFLLAKYYRQDGVAEYLVQQGAKLSFFDQCVAGQASEVLLQIEGDAALLHAYSSDGWTPLHLAAFFGSKQLAEALIVAGAEVNARSTNSMLNTPLHAAVAGNRPVLVKYLLENGADANARQSGGWTALQGAAQSGNREMVEALIAHGAQINDRADNNQSALDLALMRGHQEIVALLEGLGAKI